MSSDLKNKTAKGLAWGGLFSMLHQLSSICLGLYIARLLSPSDYGMVGMLAIFSSLAIVIQESGFVFVLTNRAGINKIEYSTVFWFNISMSFIIYVVFFLAAPALGYYFKNSNIIPLSRYIFLGFFISSFGVIQSAVLFKEMKVKERGIASFVGGILAGVVGVILALNGFEYWGLATQSLVSTLVSTCILWYYSPFRPSFVVDFGLLREILPDGIRFAVPNFISVISGEIYSLILGRYYTVRDVGFYSQARKLETFGYSFTLGMIRNVSQPMLVQVANDKEQQLNAFRKLFRFTALLSLPIMLALGLIAPELVSVLLTPKWYYSGLLLRILCVGGAFVSLSTLATYYFISANKSSLYMWVGVINSIVTIVLAVISSFWGIVPLACTCAVLDVMAFVIYYVIVYRYLNYSFRMIAADLFPVMFSVIGVIIFVYIITLPIHTVFILLLARSVLTLILFIVVMNLWHYDVFEETKVKMLDRIKRSF